MLGCLEEAALELKEEVALERSKEPVHWARKMRLDHSEASSEHWKRTLSGKAEEAAETDHGSRQSIPV